MFITIIAFVIVLGILIFFHELGHFLVAKANGVGVLKFSLGFGPALLKKRFGETEYLLSALPLGGYVKMLGEDEQGDKDILTHIDPAKSFSAKPLKVKAAIVAAGPGFNLVLAVLIYTLIAWVGIPTLSPVIGTIQDKSPAYTAGLMNGDRIISIDSTPIKAWDEIPGLLERSGAKPVDVIIERSGTQFRVHVTPQLKKDKNIYGETVTHPIIGISPAGDTFNTRYGPLSGIGYGFSQTWWVIKVTGIAFSKIASGAINLKESLGGPIMIAQVSGKTFKAGALPFLALIAFISINLAIINILPIPVLDGGYLMIFLIEGITGKPIKDRPREIAQQIGLFLLILLMLFAFYNDIARIIAGK